MCEKELGAQTHKTKESQTVPQGPSITSRKLTGGSKGRYLSPLDAGK